MSNCPNCGRVIPNGPELPEVDFKSLVLCSACLRVQQRICRHVLKKADLITCRDCDARPWTAGRVARGIGGTIRAAGVGFVTLLMKYTIPSIVGSIVSLGVLYLIGVMLGWFPGISIG